MLLVFLVSLPSLNCAFLSNGPAERPVHSSVRKMTVTMSCPNGHGVQETTEHFSSIHSSVGAGGSSVKWPLNLVEWSEQQVSDLCEWAKMDRCPWTDWSPRRRSIIFATGNFSTSPPCASNPMKSLSACLKRFSSSGVFLDNGTLRNSFLSGVGPVSTVPSFLLNSYTFSKIVAGARDCPDSANVAWSSVLPGSNSVQPPSRGEFKQTSVILVTLSFIILMLLSLVWLVYYYIQRFRYYHFSYKLNRKLGRAVKTAMMRIPIRHLAADEPLVGNKVDHCAVCLECYAANDLVRMMPCSHVFHRRCVDPWLYERHSCPMCKLDILKHFGLKVRLSTGGSGPFRRGRRQIVLGDTSNASGLRQLFGSGTAAFDLDSAAMLEHAIDDEDMPTEMLRYSSRDRSGRHSSWDSMDSDDVPVMHIDLPVSVQLAANGQASGVHSTDTGSTGGLVERLLPTSCPTTSSQGGGSTGLSRAHSATELSASASAGRGQTGLISSRGSVAEPRLETPLMGRSETEVTVHRPLCQSSPAASECELVVEQTDQSDGAVDEHAAPDVAQLEERVHLVGPDVDADVGHNVSTTATFT